MLQMSVSLRHRCEVGYLTLYIVRYGIENSSEAGKLSIIEGIVETISSVLLFGSMQLTCSFLNILPSVLQIHVPML